MDYGHAIAEGVSWALHKVAFATGAGVIFGLWIFVAAMLLGHFVNWLIQTVGQK